MLCGELLAGHGSGLPQQVVLSGVELNISGLLQERQQNDSGQSRYPVFGIFNCRTGN